MTESLEMPLFPSAQEDTSPDGGLHWSLRVIEPFNPAAAGSCNWEARASLQPSGVIVNARGRLKMERCQREVVGAGSLEGLAAANRAANVDSDG